MSYVLRNVRPNETHGNQWWDRKGIPSHGYLNYACERYLRLFSESKSKDRAGQEEDTQVPATNYEHFPSLEMLVPMKVASLGSEEHIRYEMQGPLSPAYHHPSAKSRRFGHPISFTKETIVEQKCSSVDRNNVSRTHIPMQSTHLGWLGCVRCRNEAALLGVPIAIPTSLGQMEQRRVTLREFTLKSSYSYLRMLAHRACLCYSVT